MRVNIKLLNESTSLTIFLENFFQSFLARFILVSSTLGVESFSKLLTLCCER